MEKRTLKLRIKQNPAFETSRTSFYYASCKDTAPTGGYAFSILYI